MTCLKLFQGKYVLFLLSLLPVMSYCSTTLSGNLTSLGVSALTSGNYGTATTDFYQALSLASTGSTDYNRAEYYLTRSFTELGNFSTAQSFITALLQGDTTGGYVDGALYYQMRIALQQTNFSLLSTSFRQLRQNYPQAIAMPAAYLRYAEGLRIINQDYADAIYYDQQILTNYSTNFIAPLASIDLAIVYWSNYNATGNPLQLNYCEQALDQCQFQYSDNSSVAPKCVYWQGYVQEYGNNNYSVAIADYQKLLNQWPTDSNCPAALFEMAKSYEYSQDNTDAIATYQKFIQQYPNHLWVMQAKQSITALGGKD